MRFIRFERSSVFPVEVEVLWAFHMRPDALALLTPSWLRLEVTQAGAAVANGSLVRFRLGRGVRLDWAALHTGVVPNVNFTDVAVAGPFPCWIHQHGFEVVGRGRARLHDVVSYVLPRWVPRLAGRLLVNLLLGRMFAWRHARTLALVRRPPRPIRHRAVHVPRRLVTSHP